MLLMIGQREWFEMLQRYLFVCLHLLQQAANTWEWNRLAVPASQFRSLKTYWLTVVSTIPHFIAATNALHISFYELEKCHRQISHREWCARWWWQKKDRVVTSLVVLWTYGHPWMPWPDANDAPKPSHTAAWGAADSFVMAWFLYRLVNAVRQTGHS